MSLLIKDSAQRTRVRQPNQFGMNPMAAERLRADGIDPAERAHAIQSRFGSVEFSRRPSTDERLAALRASLAAIPSNELNEFNLDPNSAIVRTRVATGAIEADDDESMLDMFAPVEFLDTKKGLYKVRARDTALQEIDTRVGPSGTSEELPDELSDLPYDMTDYSLKQPIKRITAMLAPDLENRILSAAKVRASLSLQEEIRVARLLMAASTYAASNRRTLSAGAQWNRGASADPIGDCQTAIAACTRAPTHAAMSLEVWNAVQANDDFMAIVGTRTDNKGLLTTESFALYWGLLGVCVSRRQYIPAGASTYSRMYGTSSLAFVRVNTAPNARTFLRRLRMRQGVNGMVSSAFFEADNGPYGTDYEKLAYTQAELVVDNTYGYLLTDVRQ